MRLIRTILVLLLVVGFPMLSWYYLSTGANWRISGLEALEAEGTLIFDYMQLDDGTKLSPDDLNGKFVILADLDGDAATEELDGIAKQFGYRTDLLLINMQESVGKSEPVSKDKWSHLNCDEMDCGAIRDQLAFNTSANLAFLDRDAQLRNTYELPDEISAVIREAAILLPTVEREKIELKHGTVN